MTQIQADELQRSLAVWALDDNSIVEDTLRDLLKHDGWTFEYDNREYGVVLEKFYGSRTALLNELPDDSANYPILFVLDGNLGGGLYEGKPDKYGGFHAWRAIVDKLQRAPLEEWPEIVIYTRDNEWLELAAALSSPPASPVILPFGSDAGRDLGEQNARLGFSGHLQAALEKRRQRILASLEAKDPKLLVESVRLLTEENIHPCTIALSHYSLASLFPQQVRRLISEKSSPHEQEVSRQEICNALLHRGMTFRRALQGFVRFFLEDPHKNGVARAPLSAFEATIVAEKAGLSLGVPAGDVRTFVSDPRINYKVGRKPNHWVNHCRYRANCDRCELTIRDRGGARACMTVEEAPSLAAAIVLEANERWGGVLAIEANHRRGEAKFQNSRLWQAFVQTCDGVKRTTFKLADCDTLLGVLQNEYKHQIDHAADDSLLARIVAPLGQQPLTSTQYWEYVAVNPADLALLAADWSSVARQGFSNSGASGNGLPDVWSRIGNFWFDGGYPEGIQILCDLGRSPKEWSILKTALPKMREDPRAGSLSEVCDVVCRIYSGQIFVFNVNDDMIDAAVARGPWGSADNCTARDVLGGFYETWREKMQNGHVYNLVCFRKR